MKVATESIQQPECWMKPAEFTLQSGIIGFPEAKQIELILNPEELPFMWLRSVDTPALNFIVIEPNDTVPDYTLEISDEDAASIGIEEPSDAMIFNIVTMKDADPASATVNLIGPIVVNRHTLIGRQIIVLNYSDYSARYPLLQEEPAGVVEA